jgi:hypothetical protein
MVQRDWLQGVLGPSNYGTARGLGPGDWSLARDVLFDANIVQHQALEGPGFHPLRRWFTSGSRSPWLAPPVR